MITIVLLMTDAAVKDGLTTEGILWVNIDQLNTLLFLNHDLIQNQQVTSISGGVVYQDVFSKLTRGKLLKQQNWSEW